MLSAPERLIPAPSGGSSANTTTVPSIYSFEPFALEIIPATANGNVTPTQSFTYPSGRPCLGGAMDAAFNAYIACPELIYSLAGEVDVFSTSSGPHPAVRTISGPDTGIQFATNVAVGGPNNDIYVLEEAALNGSNSVQILVFDKNASGDATPKRRIIAAEFPGETPCISTDAFDIAVDPAGNVYITIQPGGGIFIYKYAPNAQGNDAPIAAIVRQDFQMFGLALDSAGNIYTTGGGGVLEYAAGSTGAAVPIRTIHGPDTGLSGPRSVAVDAAGTIYVGGEADNRGKISVFAASATGDAAPIRTIVGPDALTNTPNALVVQ